MHIWGLGQSRQNCVLFQAAFDFFETFTGGDLKYQHVLLVPANLLFIARTLPSSYASSYSVPFHVSERVS